MTETARDSVLLFGQAQRTLPSAVERVAYSFLSLFDLAWLFWASKATTNQATSAIRNLRRLTFEGSAAFGKDTFPAAKFALGLAFRFCESLTHIDIDCDDDCRDWVACRHMWLSRILDNNRKSIRDLQAVHCQTKETAAKMLACPTLEVLDFGSNPIRALLPDSLFAKITPENLPNLRCLKFGSGREAARF